MRLTNKVLLVVLILHLSCGGRPSQVSDESFYEANRLLTEYLTKGDKEGLLRSYEHLKSNKYFNGEGLTKSNYDLVVTILMYLRKYDELELLVMRNESVVREREIALNLLRALRIWRDDSLAAYAYIDENISVINRKLMASPTDSLLYVDYFIMRIYRFGREETLLKLDSFKRVDKTFPPDFHDHVLRDVLEEYPDEFLFFR